MPGWHHASACPPAPSAGPEPKHTAVLASSLLLPTLLSKTKWVLQPEGGQSSPVTGPPRLGFIINPFSWQLPKALIATSPSYVLQFLGLAGSNWSPSFQSSPFLSTPGQLTPPLHARLSSEHQMPSKHNLPTLPDLQDHDLKKDVESLYFLISLFTSLPHPRPPTRQT